MKNVMNFFVLVSVAVIVLFSCSKEDHNVNEGSVKFTIGTSGLKSMLLTDSTGTYDTISANCYAVLTIASKSGAIVINSKQLKLYKFGEGYITETLRLPVGGFELTQFVIIDSSRVKYVSPVTGSTRAQFVTKPLPIDFVVEANKEVVLKPEVLNAEDFSPIDFGYSSFNFSVVKIFTFLMNCTFNDSASFVFYPVPANMKIKTFSLTDSTVSVYNYELKSGQNVIEITEASEYFITVSKNGYTTIDGSPRWEKGFSYSELKSASYNPIEVALYRNTSGAPHDTVIFYPPVDTISFDTPKDSIKY